jgi:hypothetical protein
LINPVTGLGRGEAICRDPVQGIDRYLRVYFVDAAKDMPEGDFADLEREEAA